MKIRLKFPPIVESEAMEDLNVAIAKLQIGYSKKDVFEELGENFEEQLKMSAEDAELMKKYGQQTTEQVTEDINQELTTLQNDNEQPKQ